jgi:HEPN domain-containing protein
VTAGLREAHLDNFALRCFRDVADGDYISARFAFRVNLIPQALWLSEQAIEKYIKCILLLRRVAANKPSHSPANLLLKVEECFPLSLSSEVREFIQYIDVTGPDRYFTFPYSTDGIEICRLDRAVWELRRYCTPYRQGESPNGTPLAELDIEHIEDAVNREPQEYKPLSPGLLDDILSGKHSAKQALIWNNLYFGRSHRKTIRLRKGMVSTNSPLALYPEVLEAVQKYVFLPKYPFKP